MDDKAITSLARRVTLSVSIGGHDATSALQPSLLDFTFTDNASGEADEVQISLHDREGHWNSDWKPSKGTPVTASITVSDWFGPNQNASLPCGEFTIDEVTFSGPPDKVSIKAVSSALTTGLRDTAKTRGWENFSLRGMAEQIAAENGLTLIYDGPEHNFNRHDQRSESDLAFLNRLAKERAMNCKVHDGKLILFHGPAAESRPAGLTIPKTGSPLSPVSYSFKQSSSGTAYTSAEASYTDPALGETHTATANATGSTDTNTGAGKTLTLDTRVESPAEAENLAESALYNANSEENSASLELMGHPGLVAGVTVNLSGFGDFSGTYFVKKAEHKVSGSGGYTTSVELTKRQG